MKDWDGHNRRNFVRMKYPCLLVMNKGEGDRVSILTHTDNISAGGVYIILKDPLEMNSMLELEMDLMDMTTHINCDGKIVWVQERQGDSEVKPNFYNIGIEFTGMTKADTARLEKLIEYLHKRQDEVPFK